MEEAVCISTRRNGVTVAKLVGWRQRFVGHLCVEQDDAVPGGIECNDMRRVVGDEPDLAGGQIHIDYLTNAALVTAEKGDPVVVQPTDGTRVVERVVVSTYVMDTGADTGRE